MNRRFHLLGALNAAFARRAFAAPRPKIVIALFDGFGPDHLAATCPR